VTSDHEIHMVEGYTNLSLIREEDRRKDISKP